MPSPPAKASDVTSDLYALVVHLHVSAHRDLLDAIAREQLSFSQLQLLDYLRRGHQPTIRQAAAVIDVTPHGASRIVEQLARRGLVRREPDQRDSRAKRVVITDRGAAAIVRLHAARLDRIAAFAAGLEPVERRMLERTLSRLAKRDEIAACRPRAA